MWGPSPVGWTPENTRAMVQILSVAPRETGDIPSTSGRVPVCSVHAAVPDQWGLRGIPDRRPDAGGRDLAARVRPRPGRRAPGRPHGQARGEADRQPGAAPRPVRDAEDRPGRLR